MNFKSFYRKKTTKIYLIILILIFSVFSIIIRGKKYYIEKINLNFNNSFLYLTSNDEIKIENVNNVKSVKRGSFNGMFYYVEYHYDLNDNEVIFPDFLRNTFQINDQIEYIRKDENYNFIVTGYYETDSISPIVYINSFTLDYLNKESNNFGYILSLNEWSKKDSTIKDINNKYNLQASIIEVNKANINFHNHIRNFTTYTYLITGVFIITSIIIVYNILNDEKVKLKLLRILGYSKMGVIKVELINIVSLFVIAFLISFIFNKIMTLF